MVRDEAGDSRISVGGSTRIFLASQRKNDSGISGAGRRKLVRLIPRPHFKPRPFAPEVDSRGGLDDIRDIGAADAGGDFDEIKFAVRVRTQELSLGHPAQEAEPFPYMAIDFETRFGFLRFP